jgi:alkanesulfonate monooxygenase SsuD/methylene tetrahydromethanopterin reductase-like flavin-dependent oxidoreductase (luciferase family)
LRRVSTGSAAGACSSASGAGWFDEEIRALGYEPRNRGRRLDEAIEVIRDCWTGETSQFAGTQLSVEAGVLFLPTPAQPTIPVLVGGMSKRAVRRAARLGDGWIPDAPIEMLDFDALIGRKQELMAQRREAGRAELPFEHVLVVDTPSHRINELPAVARRVRELGFDELVVELPFEEPQRVRASLAAIRAALRT